MSCEKTRLFCPGTSDLNWTGKGLRLNQNIICSTILETYSIFMTMLKTDIPNECHDTSLEVDKQQKVKYKNMQSVVVIEFKSHFHSIEPTVYTEHVLSTSAFSLEGPLLSVTSMYLFRSVCVSHKKHQWAWLCLSVHLSACISLAPTRWICLKFDIGDCY